MMKMERTETVTPLIRPAGIISQDLLQSRCWRVSLSGGSLAWFETRGQAEKFLDSMGLKELYVDCPGSDVNLAVECLRRTTARTGRRRQVSVHE